MNSEAVTSSVVDLPPRTSKPSRRLSEPQKYAIVSAVSLGETQQSVAKRFKVNPNTVCSLVKSVKQIAQSPLSPSWRARLADEIPRDSVDAIHASVLDREDVHKAATTGIAILKGIGVLASENSSTVNIFMNDVSRLPQDWQKNYFNVDDAQPVEATDVTGKEDT